MRRVAVVGPAAVRTGDDDDQQTGDRRHDRQPPRQPRGEQGVPRAQHIDDDDEPVTDVWALIVRSGQPAATEPSLESVVDTQGIRAAGGLDR
jgi:hypothetical protein